MTYRGITYTKKQLIQEARKEYEGMLINAAGFTHTSVAIRDALQIFKKPKIELHISNIYLSLIHI